MRRTSAAESPSRQRTSLIVLGVLVVLAFIVVAALQSLRDLGAQERRIDELQSRIAAAEGRIEGLENRITKLQDDPVAIERAARRELGFIRPGERVYVFSTRTPPAPRGDAPP